VAHERDDALVTAVDVSAEALALAAENATRNGLEGRIELLGGDLFAPVAGRRFDLVLANLPYVGAGSQVDPEVSGWEPAVAVYSEADGRSHLERLAAGVGTHLEPGGTLAAEVGHDQGEWLAARLVAAGLPDVRVEADLAGIERIVLARRH
jgi:release factor glutamine methyltransferase